MYTRSPCEVGQRSDRLGGREIAGVPGAGAQPGDAFHLAIRLLPDLLQAVPVPQRRHVQAVARGEREVGGEHRDVDRRRHRIVVALRGIDGAGLHRPEQLALRHQLVGGVELDHHLAVGGDIERVDRRLDHVLGQRGAGIGLQPPPDRALRPRDVGRADRAGRDRGSGGQARRSSGTRVCWSCQVRSFSRSLDGVSFDRPRLGRHGAIVSSASRWQLRCRLTDRSRGWAATARSAETP